MKVIREYEEDGYILKEYENGAIVKEIIGRLENIEETESFLNEYLDDEKFKRNMMLDIEYLKCLAEINGGF